jgi:hypothetical protein
MRKELEILKAVLDGKATVKLIKLSKTPGDLTQETAHQ